MLKRRDLRPDRIAPGDLHRRGQLALLPGIVDVIEEREELIILPLRDRVELVRMALGTTERQSEEDGADQVDPIDGHLEPDVLVFEGAVGHHGAEKARGDRLVDRCAGQEVTRELLDHEPVEREVAVKGVNHPFTILAHGAGGIGFRAAAIRVSGGVEPVPPPTLTVGRRGEEPFHAPLVRIRAAIREEGFDFVDRGWQPRQIQGQPTQQGRPVGLGAGRIFRCSKGARMKRSIGLRTQDASRTGGTGGRTTDRKAQ